jgi:hypothetical protein
LRNCGRSHIRALIQSELRSIRVEKRLAAVTAFNRGGCPQCKDAEARAFLAKLKRVANENGRSNE